MVILTSAHCLDPSGWNCDKHHFLVFYRIQIHCPLPNSLVESWHPILHTLNHSLHLKDKSLEIKDRTCSFTCKWSIRQHGCMPVLLCEGIASSLSPAFLRFTFNFNFLFSFPRLDLFTNHSWSVFFKLSIELLHSRLQIQIICIDQNRLP